MFPIHQLWYKELVIMSNKYGVQMNSIVTSRKYNKKKYRERKAFEKRCKELSGKVYTRKATPEELEAAFGKGEN